MENGKIKPTGESTVRSAKPCQRKINRKDKRGIEETDLCNRIPAEQGTLHLHRSKQVQFVCAGRP